MGSGSAGARDRGGLGLADSRTPGAQRTQAQELAGWRTSGCSNLCWPRWCSFLLWQPAIVIAELKPQQNIIAVLVDDSRSMGISDNGATREAQAVKALQRRRAGAAAEEISVRLYRLDSHLTRVSSLDEFSQAAAPATHIGDGLKQLAAETADLPIGAVVLLSDGSDNSGGIDRDTIAALRNRHIPVHTVGFGLDSCLARRGDERRRHRAARAGRLPPVGAVSFHQRGYAGRKANALRARRGQSSGVSRNHFCRRRKDSNRKSALQRRKRGRQGAAVFDRSSARREESREQQPSRALSTSTPTSAAFFMWKASRAGNTNSSAARRTTTASVQFVSMLRTTENKIYRQGINDPKELADGFPTRAEDLFAVSGHHHRVGGSRLLHAGAAGFDPRVRRPPRRRPAVAGRPLRLADGGWGGSSLADVLPVVLPNQKNTFHRDPATPELTPAGADSMITRLVDDPDKNAERWKKLPYLMDYQEAGTPKPGAAVLVEMTAGGRKMPLLITENYGRGRTAVLATGGTWRWQMSQPLGDTTHDMFWQQLLRWLVIRHARARGRLGAQPDAVRRRPACNSQPTSATRTIMPAADAHVEAHIIGPNGISASVDMTPVADTPGHFRGGLDRGAARLLRGRSDGAARRTTSSAATC